MPVIAVGTTSTAGGGILNTTTTPTNVFAENRQIAVVGTKVGNHGKAPHNLATIAQGSKTVFAGPNKLAVSRVGDLATCADPILGGATSVEVG